MPAGDGRATYTGGRRPKAAVDSVQCAVCSVQGFGCRPATGVRHTPVAGVRKPPRNEPAGDGTRRVPRTPLGGFGWFGTYEGWCAEPFATVDHALGRQQQVGLLVETVVECGGCGLASMAGRRLGASVVAAGPPPAPGEIVTASSQHSDRGHDVSILMAMIGPVGR